jgi:hypothetical protein
VISRSDRLFQVSLSAIKFHCETSFTMNFLSQRFKVAQFPTTQKHSHSMILMTLFSSFSSLLSPAVS